MKKNNTSLRLLAFAIAAIALTGCASTAIKPLYGWDGYQPQVYDALKSQDTSSPESQIAKLEEAEQKIRSSGAALPPGYQAHLAMLYSKAGQPDKTVQRLTAEKEQFPESTPFMDFLLRRFTEKTAP